MRKKDFTDKVKKAALIRASHRCERCWRSNGLESHHKVPISMGGNYSLNNCVVLCHECHRLAPNDPFLLEHLFLRFASVKEMTQYYGVESEQQALEKWKIESGHQQEPIDQYQAHATLVKEKMEEKAKKGAYLGFAHPYGYDYKNRKLIITPTEARIVKEIYKVYIKGWSLAKIATHLEKKGVPTKKNGTWDKKKISNILKNPLYCGVMDWNGIIKQGQHKAIIDKNTFLEAQKVLATRSGKPYEASKFVDTIDVR